MPILPFFYCVLLPEFYRLKKTVLYRIFNEREISEKATGDLKGAVFVIDKPDVVNRSCMDLLGNAGRLTGIFDSGWCLLTVRWLTEIDIPGGGGVSSSQMGQGSFSPVGQDSSGCTQHHPGCAGNVCGIFRGYAEDLTNGEDVSTSLGNKPTNH